MAHLAEQIFVVCAYLVNFEVKVYLVIFIKLWNKVCKVE